MQFVFLPTDAVLWAIVLFLAWAWRHVRRTPALRARWARVFENGAAGASAAVLVFFIAIAALDSVHWRAALPPAPGAAAEAYSPVVTSGLDALVQKLGAAGRERSYSAPFATKAFDKTTEMVEGKPQRINAPLEHAGQRVSPYGTPATAVLKSTLLAAIIGGVSAVFAWILTGAVLAKRRRVSFQEGMAALANRDGRFPWRSAMAAGTVLWLLTVWTCLVWPDWHIFGTDAVGNDVLYEALKSVRTAIVIGTLATLATLPFALLLGIAAGYFRGWVDDVIQYIYTTISSIPSVLLIAASVLMVTVFLDKHPDYYQTSLERADLKLFLLAVIIGMTGWATLARLLRAETMKISTLDYVRAAKALGVSSFQIMRRHVLPNVLHIVLIVTVLDFSGIVLYEAVLSYVGVGVDPAMHSFGTLINAARSELSRSPMVWWNLAASFCFLLAIVLPANLFAAAVRDAFDPRAAAAGAVKRLFGRVPPAEPIEDEEKTDAAPAPAPTAATAARREAQASAEASESAEPAEPAARRGRGSRDGQSAKKRRQGR